MAEPKDGAPPTPERIYSAKNVLASAETLTPSEVPQKFGSMVANPCFKTSFLWAAQVGTLFALHRFKQGGVALPNRLRAANDAVLSFGATFGTQWYLCRNDEIDKRLSMQSYYMQRQGQAAPFPDGGLEIARGEGASEGWRAELERLTTYELPTVERGPAESMPVP
jgi:hypothetical protein